MGIKNFLANKIAYLLPDRLVIWVIIRAFAYTTTHEASNKTPDETGYSDVYKSWEAKLGKKV